MPKNSLFEGHLSKAVSDSVRLLLAWFKISASLAFFSVLLDSTKPQHIKDE